MPEILPSPLFPWVLCCHPSVRAWSEFLSAPVFWCPICVSVAVNFLCHLFLFTCLQSYFLFKTRATRELIPDLQYFLSVCVARGQENILEFPFTHFSHVSQGAVMGVILRGIIEWEVRKGAPFKPHLIIIDVKMWKKVYILEWMK